MDIEINYICGICKTGHPLKEDALACEKRHPKVATMKVYVVCEHMIALSGSDFQVLKVFKNKQNAEKYINKQQTDYDAECVRNGWSKKYAHRIFSVTTSDIDDLFESVSIGD